MESLIMSVEEVAKIIGVTPMRVRFFVLNGTMPVGAADSGGDGRRSRTIIIRKRFELWINGIDLISNTPLEKMSLNNAETELLDIEIVKVADAAKLLHTTPLKIRYGIESGTLPIGFIAPAHNENEENTVIIIKKRLELWLNGTDLKRY